MFTFDIIHKRAQLSPDKIALREAGGGRALSYLALDERASRLAEAMRERLGLRPGERVAILCQNTVEFYEALFACAKAELVLVSLNWRLSVDELEFIMRDCKPRLLIADPAFAEPARELGERLADLRQLLLGAQPQEGVDSYERLLQDASGRPLVMPARDVDATWFLLYTSGTTGKPKGVIQTFAMSLANYLNIGLPSALSEEDTSLNVLPQFHTGGIGLYTMPTLIAGGTAVLMRSFDAQAALDELASGITVFLGVPAIYLMLRQQPRFAEADLSGVRVWASGGAPMPVSLLEQYAERGVVIRQGFGMTETGPTVFLLDREHALSKVGSVGKPQLYVDTRVVDAQGRDCPAGEAGELLIKGPGVTPGYWGRPDLTAEAFNEEGWMYSGDIARVDADGYYYIVDRSKDMFISGGENVYPAEAENLLFRHPAVAEVAVIGVPDEQWGEVGLAVVAPQADQSVSGQELIEFCTGKLARYKIPKRVEFVEALPRNAAGKVVKPELRKIYVSK